MRKLLGQGSALLGRRVKPANRDPFRCPPMPTIAELAARLGMSEDDLREMGRRYRRQATGE